MFSHKRSPGIIHCIMSSSVIQVAEHKSFMILVTSTVHTILRSYEVHVASFISVSLHMVMNSVGSHWVKNFKKKLLSAP